MTLKEADEIATQRLPVTHHGVTYVRITQIGYKYREDGSKLPYIRLQDKSGHSFTYASPQQCKVASDEAENKENNDETADNC